MNTVHTPSTEVYDLMAALAEERNQAEYDLIGAMISDPTRGLKLADAAGLSGHHFQCDDLLTIYLSVVTIHRLRRFTGDIDHDQLRACLLARGGLRRNGWWRVGVFGWDDERLGFLADAWPGVSQVPVLARRVVELHHRAVEADQGYRRCLELLGFRAEPDLSSPIQKPRPLIMLAGRGVA